MNCAWLYASLIDSLTLIWWIKWLSLLKRNVTRLVRSCWSSSWSSCCDSCHRKSTNRTTLYHLSSELKWSNQTEECWSSLQNSPKFTSTNVSWQVIPFPYNANEERIFVKITNRSSQVKFIVVVSSCTRTIGKLEEIWERWSIPKLPYNIDPEILSTLLVFAILISYNAVRHTFHHVSALKRVICDQAYFFSAI